MTDRRDEAAKVGPDGHLTICVHCSMKALVNNQPSPRFTESPADHLRIAHPDLEATALERRQLEEQLMTKLGQKG